jgi:gliding motility-associated transport system ATP-binding protein
MIEAKKLTKYYGQIAAIEDVTFQIGKGEIVGFLGPNGAGKTTTMRILTGFSPATRGTAKIAGFHIDDDPIEVKRRVGYMPESVPFYGEMLVESFLRYVAEVKGISRGDRRRAVGKAMERTGLDHMGKRIVRNISKGYRQRLGLAQALIGEPPVLILDEPTVGLDPKQIVDIRQMIKDLANDHTVLLSTHILPEVAMICERVLIINRGRIVAQDSMSNLTSAETASLEVEALGNAGAVEDALRRTPGVRNVAREEKNRYGVQAEGDVREAVAKALSGGGLRLVGLRQRSRTLEEIFVDVVSTDGGAGT